MIRQGCNITLPWRLTLGDHVWIGEDLTILSLAEVVVGSNVCISQQAYLCTGSHDHSSETFDLVVQPIRIGDGVWVAARAFVGPGVDVGANALLAAGCVVVKNVPEGARMAGNPARPLGSKAT